MLSRLRIRNYALIRELDLQPHRGLNTVTGETGAGKSIMLGAVGLLLGERADKRVLLHEGKTCSVSGTFQIATYQLQGVFAELELPYQDTTEVVREISPAGKSKATVNGQPARLDQLKPLASHLVDIHSQHDTLRLGDGAYQLALVDTLAGNKQRLADYGQAYRRLRQAERELQQLRDAAAKVRQDEDYLRFQWEELEKVQLDTMDQEALEDELKRLENGEEILQRLQATQAMLDLGEVNAQQLLDEALSQLRQVSGYGQAMAQLAERLASIKLELDDVVASLQDEADRTELDPERLQEVKAQVDELIRLQTKHKVQSVEQLVTLRDQLAAQLAVASDSQGAIGAAQHQVDEALAAVQEKGATLTQAREHAAALLPDKLLPLLAQLGMEHASLEVEWRRQEPGPQGLETVDLLFSANRGLPPRELRFVASGGEFSRLMFAIKHLLATKMELPTLIFDEVDAGISGEVAQQMALMMREMAHRHQLITITHLPQIAAQGQAHFFVYKDLEETLPASRMRQLSEKEREEHLATMISGDTASAAALQAARDLLSAKKSPE